MQKLKTFPPMKCDSGCGRCCGIVPVTETEFQRVARYAQEHALEPVDQGITCPWYQGDKCAVYDVRPLVCRMFGHVPQMECPKGYNVNIPERQAQRMILSNGQANRTLHEIMPNSSFLNDLARKQAESAISS